MTVAPMDISREQRTELLARADPDSIQRLAERALGYTFVAESLVVIKKPETGLVMMQVREPVCKERFYLGEIAATRAEVLVNNEKGWAIRLGTDKATVLGAAILDAICEIAHVDLSGIQKDVEALCIETARRESISAIHEWNEISPTIVNFEELD